MHKTEDMSEASLRMREQLSAWMDGELSVEESRFLLRRLEHDDTLRAEYARWQLASAAMRRHPLQLASPSLAERLRRDLHDEPSAQPNRRRLWMPWAAAASVALGLFIAVPAMRGPQPTDSVVASTDSPPSAIDATASAVPSLASADLVASEHGGDSAASNRSTQAIASASSPTQAAELPETFEIPAGKPWPKSQIKDDAAMDALLIRHGEMLQGQGVGGFTPFVDVVSDAPVEDASPTAATPSAIDSEGAQR